MTKIGSYVLNGSGLKKLTVPDSVVEIGTYAFMNTPWYRYSGDFVILGDGLLLYYQGNQTEISLPENVKRVSEGAFAGSVVKKVEMPEGVEEIGRRAFEGAASLEEVILPESLKK